MCHRVLLQSNLLGITLLVGICDHICTSCVFLDPNTPLTSQHKLTLYIAVLKLYQLRAACARVCGCLRLCAHVLDVITKSDTLRTYSTVCVTHLCGTAIASGNFLFAKYMRRRGAGGGGGMQRTVLQLCGL